jgi:hypothetical protein
MGSPMAQLTDPKTTREIAARWQLALGDAGLRDGDDAILHVFEGVNEPGLPGAMAVEPGSCACEAEVAGFKFPFRVEEMERSLASRDVYEILIYSGFPPRAQLAVLRHELEHVRQFGLSLYLLRASTAILEGLLANVPNALARSLYIALPTERAADAAGRRLSRAALGPATEADRGRGHDVLLLGPDDGPSDAEIRWRMLANLMVLPVWTADAAIACFCLQLSREEALANLADGLCPDEGPGIAELRLHQQKHWLAVAQHMLDRRGWRSRVEHNADGAEVQRRGLGDRKLRPVARQESDALAASHAKSLQRASNALHRSRVDRPGERPTLIGVIDERDPVGHARGADLERLTERCGKKRSPLARGRLRRRDACTHPREATKRAREENRPEGQSQLPSGAVVRLVDASGSDAAHAASSRG